MDLQTTVACTLSNLKLYLLRLDMDRYQQAVEHLSLSSTGQHTRHIIEFLQCLLEQYPGGVINYDKRRRDKKIEENPAIAIEAIEKMVDSLSHSDFSQVLTLESTYDPEGEWSYRTQTTFKRELVYNIEHAIHHMAMIRIGLKVIAPEINLPPEFGVAPSTIRHQLSKFQNS